MFKLNSNYFSLDEKEKFFRLSMKDYSIVKSNKNISYYNIPAAFDIETSSFYSNIEGTKTSNYLDASKGITEKRAIIYTWQFGLNGNVMFGRNIIDFQNFLCWLSVKLKLNRNLRLLVYVHNLQYEFQFIRKYFTWEVLKDRAILASDDRKPLYAITNLGIEFRCSYMLSGYSLDNVSKNLQKYKVAKLVGSLDYEKIRHEKTPLTSEEIAYCVNDVLVVMAYIQEEIEQYQEIHLIPLTNTGRVRKYCKRACLGEKGDNYKFTVFHNIIKKLTLTPVVYTMLKRAFQGGFVHANSYYVNKTVENVSSYDFTSSYPYVMLSEQFPMSSAIRVNPLTMEELNYYLNNFCCLIDITFYNIYPKLTQDNFISVSKCLELENHVENNGRIVSADKLRITITELDFAIIYQAYNFDIDKLNIRIMFVFKKDYLPIDFTRAILKLYADKTELKGVEDKTSNYLISKGMLNSCYGMCVTDIVRDENNYDSVFHEWIKEKGDIEKTLEKYNHEKGRFLFYAWGVWVTAYARYNLFRAIEQLGNDYIYADTDSVKFVNLSRNQHIFDEYNREVEIKLRQVANERNLSLELFKPKTIKGVEKLIGVFDFEGTYLKFKTLGAKRYMTYDGKNFSITVAGLPKNASNYLLNKYGIDKVFENFTFGLKIPAEYSDKFTYAYLDNSYSGIVTDYLGVPYKYETLSGYHLEKTTFEISISEKYEDFLREFEKGIIEFEN